MSTATTAIAARVRDRVSPGTRTGAVIVGVIPPLGVASDSRMARTSSAVWGRSAGFFSRQRMTSCDNAAGNVARRVVTATGASVTCATSTPCGVADWKGGRPVSISYAMTPRA